jgi:hypothetical protein
MNRFRILMKHQALQAAEHGARAHLDALKDALDIARAERAAWERIEDLSARQLEAEHAWRCASRALAAYRAKHGLVIFMENVEWGRVATLGEILAPMVEAERQLAALEARHYAYHMGHIEACTRCRRERKRLRTARTRAWRGVERALVWDPPAWW